MNTKTIVFIISVLMSFTASFAHVNTNGVNTITIVDSIGKIKPVYILDEKKIKAAAFRNIDPKSIFKVNVLKQEAAITKYGAQAKDGAIVVVTKKFAAKVYQQKLSSLSEEYKKYLKKHRNDDRLLFIINGVEYRFSSWERTEKLYNIFSDDAKFNSFKLSYVTGIDGIPSSVIINTKAS